MATALESIPSLLKQLVQLTDETYNESKGFSSAQQRHAFIRLAERLAIHARDPGENVYYAGTRMAHNSAIRTAVALNIFHLVPEPEDNRGTGASYPSVGVDELARRSGADKLLIERMMRVLVACNVFDEVKESVYAHNLFSLAFTQTHNRHMFQQMYDFLGNGVFFMPQYLEQIGWKNPESYEKSAFTTSMGIDEGFWEWLAAKPERQAVFNSGMKSQPKFNMTAIYPFDQELNAEPVGSGEVVLVDVGGGLGQALIDIKTAFPKLQGRMVLQDQEVVIEDARSRGLPSFIELHAASFFEPNPVKNARAYYFRRIFHDWPDSTSLTIIKNTVEAMGPSSRFLIADLAMPTQNAVWSMALQDWNMMALGGLERTYAQWEQLLTKAGLVLVKVWRAEDSNQVVIEARKPQK